MWNKPYSLKEGSAITVGLMLIGLILQFTIGPLEWGLFMWPANIIALTIFVALLLVAWLLRKHFYFCRFMASIANCLKADCLLTQLVLPRCSTSGPLFSFMFG